MRDSCKCQMLIIRSCAITISNARVNQVSVGNLEDIVITFSNSVETFLIVDQIIINEGNI